jgi:hypothetical protein
MLTSRNVGLSPERIGNNPEVCCCRRLGRVKWSVAVPRPCRHDQRARGTERIPKCLNQAEWAALNRPRGAERRVYEKDTASVDSKRLELSQHFRSSEFASGTLPLAAMHSG